MPVKNIVILGSTGSIGENALRVARHLGPENINVVGICAGSNIERLAEQAQEFNCSWACISDEKYLSGLRSKLPACCKAILPDTMAELVTAPDVDMVLCAIVGTAGFKPVLAAIEAGRDIALASKEILVMAGEIVMNAVAGNGVNMLPVDSEHCALFQCLKGGQKNQVNKLILTASGGPFRKTSMADLQHVTREQALNHPTWNMGGKITIDSATLMNKALELIEAAHLFNIPENRLDVVIHPQSIVHSMVEFVDAGVLAQLSNPDMCLPIQYAFTYPDRVPAVLKPLDFSQVMTLDFEPPDEERFKALRLAREALRTGGVLPCVLNAANEVAVASFLLDEIKFMDITNVTEQVMQKFSAGDGTDLQEILAVDERARELSREYIKGIR